MKGENKTACERPLDERAARWGWRNVRCLLRHSCLACLLGSRLLYRFANTYVRAAPANVSRHGGADIRVIGVGRRRQERRRRHDLARLTVAALHNLEFEPCSLHSDADLSLADA